MIGSTTGRISVYANLKITKAKRGHSSSGRMPSDKHTLCSNPTTAKKGKSWLKISINTNPVQIFSHNLFSHILKSNGF
jgi:hypothetical protein